MILAVIALFLTPVSRNNSNAQASITPSKKPQSATASQKSFTPKTSTKPVKSPSPQASVVTSSKTYQDNTLTLIYPSDWIYETQIIPGGGDSVLFRPKIPTALQSTIYIQRLSANTVTTEQLGTAYVAAQYAKTQAVISSIHVEKYTGLFNTQPNPIFETAYIFIHKNSIYLIKTNYINQIPDENVEKMLENIVLTLQLTSLQQTPELIE